jgi:hypothetical protein
LGLLNKPATDDEISHVAFLYAFLASKGEQSISFDAFRNIQPSKATGVPLKDASQTSTSFYTTLSQKVTSAKY